jgi:hypothetical protein
MRQVIFLLTLFISGVVQAVPVQWALDNVAFDGGQTATGSFIYDADLGASGFSDISITTISNSSITNYIYINSFLIPQPDTVSFLSGPDNVNFNDAIVFFLASDLTNAGGVIALVSPSAETYCYDNGFTGDPCGQPDLQFGSRVVSGSLVATAVPIPAALWFFASAITALGWMKRKKSIR